MDACAKAGITLIEVPYWWRKDSDSIVLEALRVRPDLPLSRPVNTSALPFSKRPPVRAKMLLKEANLE